MIRRDHTATDGTLSWVLIDQMEHAALAGRLAEFWGAQPLAPLDPRREVLDAIGHHDDGWAVWDRAPGLDPQTGTPLAFNEMPLAESLAIWDRSIQMAERWSGLAVYAVTGHFCALLRRFDSWKKDAEKGSLATEFLTRHESHMAAQLAGWLSGDHPEWTPAIASQAVAHVQCFDAMSLWLCCAERTAPEQFTPLGGPPITFTPHGPNRIEATPWPWTIERLVLDVTGREIVAQSFADSQALALAPSSPVCLEWHFERKNSNI